MTFAYRCPTHGVFEWRAGIGAAPASAPCPRANGWGHWCDQPSPRYFGPETLPQIRAQDAFRRFDLSPRKEAAQVDQQRYLDAPRDGAEARANEQARGIVYVGDDTSGMTRGARRGIEAHQAKVRAGEV